MAQPIKKFRAGQISCALWENEGKSDGRSVVMLKATIERRYKDSNGEWKSTQSFSRGDIPLAIWCLNQAFSAMLEERSSLNEVEEEVVM